MLKRINSINGVDQNYELSENELVAILKYPKQEIRLFSLDGTFNFGVLDYPAYDIVNADCFLFFTLENGSKSFSYNKKSHSVNELPYVLHIKGHKHGEEYLCFSEYRGEEMFLVIDLRTAKIVRQIDADIGFGNVQMLLGESVLSARKRQGKITRCDFANNTLWQLDLSDICAYDVGDGLEKAEISNIYEEEESLYVLAGLSVVKVSVQFGEIIWHVKLNTAQSRGLIYNGYLYTTSNAYINRIDCHTGEVLYQAGFDYIYIDNEKTLGPIMELVWYNGSIWTVMDSNPSALIEINPTAGSYKSIVPLKDLGITRDCHMPRFHESRMYLLDFDNTLHIFEMENNSESA